MPTMRLLILGTHNRKKAQELTRLLSAYEFELRTLQHYPDALKVVEDGESFADNAGLKAAQQAAHLGQWVLGEDSGLVVEALGGAPGIHSARFAGPQATDTENNRRLLQQLDQLPRDRRTAHYVCHMALADRHGGIRYRCEAICRGRIRSEEAGTAGFGYDPLFEVREYHRTFGQLGEAVKGVLSHRARAMRQLVPELIRLARDGAWDET
jgi:XTP/dITP diphosphohydrolase